MHETKIGLRKMSAGAFYTTVLQRLLSSGTLDVDCTVLVVAGAQLDANVLRDLGFKNVTISNLDPRAAADIYAPFAHSLQDAERLSYADRSFDFVFVHSGLHHCRVPHQALWEMYRVSRVGVLFFESRDSLLVRLAVQLGFIPEFEIEAVVANDMVAGGMRNTSVPNFVYRWTEREVFKITQTIDPTGRVELRYFYGIKLPLDRLKFNRRWWLRVLAALAGPTFVLMQIFVRRGGNLFAAYVGRPKEHWPWISSDSSEIERSWVEKRYFRSR